MVLGFSEWFLCVTEVGRSHVFSQVGVFTAFCCHVKCFCLYVLVICYNAVVVVMHWSSGHLSVGRHNEYQ